MRKQRRQGDHECCREAHSNNLDVGIVIGSEQGRVHRGSPINEGSPHFGW